MRYGERRMRLLGGLLLVSGALALSAAALTARLCGKRG